MIHTGISKAKAYKLFEKGGRVLKNYRNAEHELIYDVETANGTDDAPAKPAPTEKMRKAKLDLPPVTEEADEG